MQQRRRRGGRRKAQDAAASGVQVVAICLAVRVGFKLAKAGVCDLLLSWRKPLALVRSSRLWSAAVRSRVCVPCACVAVCMRCCPCTSHSWQVVREQDGMLQTSTERGRAGHRGGFECAMQRSCAESAPVCTRPDAQQPRSSVVATLLAAMQVSAGVFQTCCHSSGVQPLGMHTCCARCNQVGVVR